MADAESVGGSDSSSTHVSIEWISRNHPELVDQDARVTHQFDLWYASNESLRISPYRISQGIDLFVASDRVLLSKAKGVMKHLIQTSGSTSNQIHNMLPRERDDLFQNTFLSILYPDDNDENFDE